METKTKQVEKRKISNKNGSKVSVTVHGISAEEEKKRDLQKREVLSLE